MAGEPVGLPARPSGMDTSRLRHLTAAPFLLALLLAAALALGACSSSGESDTASAEGQVSADKAAPAEERAAAAEDGAGAAEGETQRDALSSNLDMYSDDASTASAYRSASDTPEQTDESGERSIISKGVVSVLDEDVAKARFDVQKIVDGHDGEVAQEKTETDDDGAVSRSRLVVRVPVSDFDATMEELEDVGELESSSRNSEDVTTTVIDNEVRIRAQTESLKRVEVLLARAQTIRDIVNIESQLTRRQADLDSLKSQQAYLADQTSMSTITVFLEQKPEPVVKKKAVEKEEAAAGFLAGLGSGWDALKSFLIGGATVVGAVLPFAILLLVLGVPAWILLRNLARRRPPVASPVTATQD